VRKLRGILLAVLLVGTIVTPVQAGLLGELGKIVGGGTGSIAKVALERAQREVAYQVLRSFLQEKGCRGADDYVNAIRALVDRDDWGEAAAAFYTGLDKDGTEGAREVLKVLYAAAIVVRLTDEHVANEIVSLINYVNRRYNF